MATITLNPHYLLIQKKGTAPYEDENGDYVPGTSAGGTKPKNTANFVIYETTKIDDGIVLVALIMQAYEIHESKLVLPFSDADKAALTSRFQFED